jgi:hypothetical protein
MKFAQILNNKAHWIFEADVKTDFAPNIVLVDITDNSEVQEGWNYDSATGVFSDPAEVEETAEEKLATLDISYQSQFTALVMALGLATLANNTDLIAELQAEYTNLKSAYAAAREALVNG